MCSADGSGGNTGMGGTPTGGSSTGVTITGGSSTGGNTSTGGTATGGTATGGQATGGTTTTGCGAPNLNPLGCEFAWGAPSSGSNHTYLDFVSTWMGDETNGGLSSWSATATNNSCGDCSLVQTVASTNSMVVFYTYVIGFQACRQAGLCDCNTSGGTTLCTDGAQWIRDNRAQIVNAYGQYAARVYAASPNKPVIWWLEGDFFQYTYVDEQSNALSFAELGSLAHDITCAIKSNQPNAAVFMNHAPWMSDADIVGFWGAMPMDVLDGAWVQGAGDTGTFPNNWGQSTANYASLQSAMGGGKSIMAETSNVSGGGNDHWSTISASLINERIAEGVIAVHVNSPSSGYQSAISGFSSLSSVCQ